MKKLPTSWFQCSKLSFRSGSCTLVKTNDVGYLVMEELKYPVNLHDSYVGFPLAAEKLKIDAKMALSVSGRIGKQNHAYPKTSQDVLVKAKLCIPLFHSKVLLSTAIKDHKSA